MHYLVTGTAGFIGFHLARRLLADGHDVTGVDGMTSYYDVELKRRRHAMLKEHSRFHAHEFMLEDMESLTQVVDQAEPDVMVHLAAQAGVRYSIENPRAYVDSNLIGTFNVIEQARRCRVGHLMLASTSSVYGANSVMPFGEGHCTDHPLTLYAATKKATEGMAHSYAHLWSIPTTAFRFFTVYGPWGRPDMALFRFTENALKGRPIDVYNHGQMRRDFTYVDDLVEAIVRLAKVPPQHDEKSAGGSPAAPYRVVNIGNSEPVNLLSFIEAIEKATGRKAIRNYMGMQPGDVPATWADTSALEAITGFRPNTPVSVGVAQFVDWYRSYHQV
ncbi:SDR family NAD(P)-dependent oxidoreductase [Roseomonas xinghualingensis]|uniref:SDR family NAD(P)-dependent oxidoreductase n=1 Tax=Roseomonas xinghualingensis TaxID=2986475 RepID=UPI0021F14217|nr:SDR family NAD(P)-dependent oxidoreductase [Roseomonas sp. SXEYE001]MCV4208855.1 SDR family NAD(P)-dependent oxidoreductase [Roseomonas sp. SXEYE001]